MTASESRSPLFRAPAWDVHDFDTEWPLPSIIFDESCLLMGANTWQGEEDFSARIQVGWRDDGLAVRAKVRDEDVINDVPEDLLCLRDAMEF